MQQIDDAVRPILQAKISMGLFEHPYVDEARIPEVLNDPEHQRKARTAVQRSVVLLRNENKLLPLDKNGTKFKSIAVIGPLADAETDLLGMWGAMTKPGPSVSVLQGIKNKVGNAVRVEFAHGPNIRRDIPSFFEDIPIVSMKEQPKQTPEEARNAFDEAVATAKRSDIAVLVLGEIDLMSGEAASRSSLKLSGGQQELLEAIGANGKPVVLVLVNGRPLEISWAAEHVPAILEAWYPGTQGGNGIADVLFGDANPAGHLPVSWPRSSAQLPLYYNHNLTQMPEDAPDFTSRYWDIKSTPLYPFGYGLSYTNFTFDNLNLSRAEARVGTDVNVSVDVSNMGSREGDAMVQLYIHQRAGSASRPVRQLKGFQRVDLAVGAKQTVHFTLGKDELQFWSPANKGMGGRARAVRRLGRRRLDRKAARRVPLDAVNVGRTLLSACRRDDPHMRRLGIGLRSISTAANSTHWPSGEGTGSLTRFNFIMSSNVRGCRCAASGSAATTKRRSRRNVRHTKTLHKANSLIEPGIYYANGGAFKIRDVSRGHNRVVN